MITDQTYQDNQFNETLAAHQAANGEAFAPEELVGTSGQGPARDLSDEGTRDDTNDIRPGNSVLQETQVRV